MTRLRILYLNAGCLALSLLLNLLSFFSYFMKSSYLAFVSLVHSGTLFALGYFSFKVLSNTTESEKQHKMYWVIALALSILQGVLLAANIVFYIEILCKLVKLLNSMRGSRQTGYTYRQVVD